MTTFQQHNKNMNGENNKLPYIHLYCSDWQTDAKLQTCSLAARGLWIELLFLMNDAEKFGHLYFNGESMPLSLVAKLVRADQHEIETLINELEQMNVFSRDEDGVIFSRRMLRDANKRKINQQNGRRGGNPSLKRRFKNDEKDATPGENDATNDNQHVVSNEKTTRPDQQNDVTNNTESIEKQNENVVRLTDKKTPGLIRKRDIDNDIDNDNDNDKSFSFASFWNLYDKKIDRVKCENKFKKLSRADRDQIAVHLPRYVNATQNKQFRKNPLTYLHGRCWQDEIIDQNNQHDNTNHNTTKQSNRTLAVESWVEFARG